MIKRKYPNKDVEMLIAVYTILEAALAHFEELKGQSTNWTLTFFGSQKDTVDNAFKKYLGVDSAGALRQSTLTVKALQSQILRDMRKIRLHIFEGYKGRKSIRVELLKQLGYDSFYRLATQGDLQALINLLFQFKMNLKEPVKTQILKDTGILSSVLDAAVDKAEEMLKANVQQESYKGFRRVVTQDAITEFNKIYDDAISICRIAGDHYKDNVAIKAQFNYTKIVMGIGGKSRLPSMYEDNDIPDTPTDDDKPVV